MIAYRDLYFYLISWHLHLAGMIYANVFKETNLYKIALVWFGLGAACGLYAAGRWLWARPSIPWLLGWVLTAATCGAVWIGLLKKVNQSGIYAIWLPLAVACVWCAVWDGWTRTRRLYPNEHILDDWQ